MDESTPYDMRPDVRRAVDEALRAQPAWTSLPLETRESLASSLGSLAEQLAPPVPPRPNQPPATPPPAQPGGSTTPPPGGASTPTGRVGEVARATLNAIDFPHSSPRLIQGTFKAIVDASIQQMEAYAELLRNVALTVDGFMADNITDGQAKDYLADEHPDVFGRTSRAACRR